MRVQSLNRQPLWVILLVISGNPVCRRRRMTGMAAVCMVIMIYGQNEHSIIDI